MMFEAGRRIYQARKTFGNILEIKARMVIGN